MIIFHSLAIYGLYILIFHAKLYTKLLALSFSIFSGLGITAGVHRLWTHRSYKATRLLKTILCIWNTMALQESIYHWSRDHRLHHKYSDTEADPYNAER